MRGSGFSSFTARKHHSPETTLRTEPLPSGRESLNRPVCSAHIRELCEEFSFENCQQCRDRPLASRHTVGPSTINAPYADELVPVSAAIGKRATSVLLSFQDCVQRGEKLLHRFGVASKSLRYKYRGFQSIRTPEIEHGVEHSAMRRKILPNFSVEHL